MCLHTAFDLLFVGLSSGVVASICLKVGTSLQTMMFVDLSNEVVASIYRKIFTSLQTYCLSISVLENGCFHVS